MAHFEYDGGRAVLYICEYWERFGFCPEGHEAVHEHMLDWINRMSGQMRVRRAKVDRLYGAEVDLRRVLNE